MASKQIVVLGGGYGGVMAAVRTARQTRGRAEVVLVSASDRFSERIRLHQHASGQALAAPTLAALTAQSGVRLMQGRVSAIDPAEHVVVVDGQRVPYAHLVIALGSTTDRGAVPGLEHAYTLDGTSAARLGVALPALANAQGRVLVCGGGLTGIETASEIAEAFPALSVTLVTAGVLGEGLSLAARAFLGRWFKRQGITVIERSPVQSIVPGYAQLASDRLGFDACVWTGGFCASPLARDAGLLVNERGQVLVDACLRVASHPAIYAVGDAAAPPPCGAPILMACKTAMPMGAHAADNLSARILGRAETPFTFSDSGYCISLGRRDGLIQVNTRSGQPTERIITGRLGGWLKERVCRYTTFSLRMEARGLLRYRWLRAPAANTPALADSEMKRLAA